MLKPAWRGCCRSLYAVVVMLMPGSGCGGGCVRWCRHCQYWKINIICIEIRGFTFRQIAGTEIIPLYLDDQGYVVVTTSTVHVRAVVHRIIVTNLCLYIGQPGIIQSCYKLVVNITGNLIVIATRGSVSRIVAFWRVVLESLVYIPVLGIQNLPVGNYPLCPFR